MGLSGEGFCFTLHAHLIITHMQPHKIISLLFVFVLTGVVPFSQQSAGLISGPWAGNVELRNATIWLEVSPKVKRVAVKFSAIDKSSDANTVTYKVESAESGCPGSCTQPEL